MYGIPVGIRRLSIEQTIQKDLGQSFELPDNKIIRGKTVFVNAVETFTVAQLTKTPGGATTVSANGALGLVLNLQDAESSNRHFEIPYYDYIASLNTGYPRELQPFEMVLTNSSVKVVDDTNVVDGVAVFIVLWYFYEEDIKRYGLNVGDWRRKGSVLKTR